MNDNKPNLSSSKHFFDVKVAEEVGVVPAILYENIKFWVEKNKANQKHFHDGFYWTYNSIRAFKELFPYLTEDQIRRSLQKLIEMGYIKTGNYNETAYDRTSWYAVVEIQESIWQKPQMDLAETQNGFVENHKPIPYINTDNKPNIEHIKKPSIRQDVTAFFKEYSLRKYDMPAKIDLFKIEEICKICDDDFDLFLKVVDKFVKDEFWGSKSLSPDLLLKAWHTLGNVNKIPEYKRAGFNTDKEYRQYMFGMQSKQEKLEDTAEDREKTNKEFAKLIREATKGEL